MTLSLDQLRAVAQLSRLATALRAAEREFEQAEEHCWEMGVSDRQVAVVGRRDSYTSVRRRRQRRHALAEEWQVPC